jgi:aspartyl-tRNA synthetase
MLVTNHNSIKEVILFPQMKSEPDLCPLPPEQEDPGEK